MSLLNGKYGYINHNGETVTSFIYDDAFSFRDGQARVKLNNEYIKIDSQGKIID